MSRETRWPRKPWFTWAAVIVSLASLIWFCQIRSRHMPTVEHEDFAAYVRVSMPVVRMFPIYTVMETPTGQLAVHGTTGQLTPVRIRPDREKLRDFLRSYVFGQPLWRVLLWPLCGFFAVLLSLSKLGQMLDEWNNGDRLIKGAPIISHWLWNKPFWFQRADRGFYIDTK